MIATLTDQDDNQLRLQEYRLSGDGMAFRTLMERHCPGGHGLQQC